MKGFKTSLGGVEWSIQFVKRNQITKNNWGECCSDSKIIKVREDLATINILDTLIHELRHAQHPVMFEAEEFIDRTSTELANALMKAGMIKNGIPDNQN